MSWYFFRILQFLHKVVFPKRSTWKYLQALDLISCSIRSSSSLMISELDFNFFILFQLFYIKFNYFFLIKKKKKFNLERIIYLLLFITFNSLLILKSATIIWLMIIRFCVYLLEFLFSFLLNFVNLWRLSWCFVLIFLNLCTKVRIIYKPYLTSYSIVNFILVFYVLF